MGLIRRSPRAVNCPAALQPIRPHSGFSSGSSAKRAEIRLLTVVFSLGGTGLGGTRFCRLTARVPIAGGSGLLGGAFRSAPRYAPVIPVVGRLKYVLGAGARGIGLTAGVGLCRAGFGSPPQCALLTTGAGSFKAEFGAAGKLALAAGGLLGTGFSSVDRRASNAFDSVIESGISNSPGRA